MDRKLETLYAASWRRATERTPGGEESFTSDRTLTTPQSVGHSRTLLLRVQAVERPASIAQSALSVSIGKLGLSLSAWIVLMAGTDGVPPYHTPMKSTEVGTRRQLSAPLMSNRAPSHRPTSGAVIHVTNRIVVVVTTAATSGWWTIC